ncbi:MAG: MOSC domain-containing protein [Chloroflexi bacterium]|nr:MAG: MOSC domain-containing protein [Chloroflexota bacterium]
MRLKGALVSVNVGLARPTAHSDVGITGIDKRPVDGPVEVRDPGPKGAGASGVAGDAVCDLRHHGGHDQAVYAYAREDLDLWEADVGRPLAGGAFGENLTTRGLDLTGALIGEHWLVGDRCLLRVTSPRIPCRTFAGWLEDQGWVRRFTLRGAPGAYLRVLEPGAVRAGDPIAVVRRPGHDVTIGLMFRALTLEKALIPRLLAAGDDLPDDTRELARRRTA